MSLPPVLELFPKGGWYVEAGAHDGVGDSTTKHLEEAGWQGLCVEPSRAYYGLTLARRCKTDNRVLWKEDGQKVCFREMCGEAIELSGIQTEFYDSCDRATHSYKERTVTTISLPTLLSLHQMPARIELLSLDTEGSEIAILEGHDFDRYQFYTIFVEYNGVIKRREELKLLLRSRGYNVRKDDGQDLFFLHWSLLA